MAAPNDRRGLFLCDITIRAREVFAPTSTA